MDFSEYQRAARLTDQVPDAKDSRNIIVPLLGLAGEAGSLLSEYKKYLRDGDAYRVFEAHLAEELGDIMWYVSNLATKFGLNLDDLARHNTEKVNLRWRSRIAGEPQGNKLYDESFPVSEQFPRSCCFSFINQEDSRVLLLLDGVQVGDSLTDNSRDDDGYRYHDVIHIAHMAVLGWSPVMRKILKRKRKSNSQFDEVEDGGRAAVLEEAVVAIVFEYARKHSFLEGVGQVDFSLLKQVKELTSHLEVGACSWAEWERAILSGFSVWRQLKKCKGGVAKVDLQKREIQFKAF